MMDWSERRNIRKRGPSWNPSARTRFFAADRRTSHGSKKKKPSGAQRKCLRKQKKNHITVRDLLRFFLHPHGSFHNTLVRNTMGFTGGWTMGPSAAWFYEGQLHLHQN